MMLRHGLNISVLQKDSNPTSNVQNRSSMASEHSTSLPGVLDYTVTTVYQLEPEFQECVVEILV